MPVNSDALSQAISNLALIQDDQPRHTGNVSNKVDIFRDLLENDHSEEAFYMLATYCFDVSKRFAMVCDAISNVYATGTPNQDLAALIVSHDHALNDPNVTTWSDRATIAGEQLSIWHTRVNSANQAYRAAALNSGGQGQGG